MFYRISPDSSRKYCYAWKDTSFEGYQKHICGQCGRTIAEQTFNGECHRLLLEGGKEYPDCLDFTGAGKQLFLLSRRAVECLREKGISGFFDTVTIDVCDEKGNPISGAPEYQHLEIIGRIEINYAQMQMKKKRICPFCEQFDWNRQRLPALVIDEESWDGCDLCRIASMPGFMVCSERFKTVVLESGLKGFCFSKLKYQ